MILERISRSMPDTLLAQTGSDEVDQFISQLAEQEVPLMIGSSAFLAGLLVMNEYVESRESKGKSVGRVGKAASFCIGFLGGGLASTPVVLLAQEAMSGDL